MRGLTILIIFLAVLVCASLTVAQQVNQSSEATATCTFDSGKQITLRYSQIRIARGESLPVRVWAPGGSPMFLFTEAKLSVATSTVPAGAHSVYVIGGRQEWTLVVNKNINLGDTYDEKQDLLRTSMQTGTLPEPEGFRVDFGRIGPKQCELRIDYGKTRAWVVFTEE